ARCGGAVTGTSGPPARRFAGMSRAAGRGARAVCGLPRRECMPPALQPGERRRMDEWRAQALDQVDADTLPAWLRNRIVIRRASVWSSLAYQRARAGDAPGFPPARPLLHLSRL